MNISERQINQCFQAGFDEADGLSDEERRIRALMAVHDQFHLLEGPDSSEVHETTWHLLLPKLRTELRRWYQRPAVDTTPAARALRDYLSQFAGEKL